MAHAPASRNGFLSVGLTGYVALGIEHIVTGYDHIAFVLALLLVAASLREVAGLVTGFTVAHSLTLALATLGVLHPQAHAVEALIEPDDLRAAAEADPDLARRVEAFSADATAAPSDTLEALGAALEAARNRRALMGSLLGDG